MKQNLSRLMVLFVVVLGSCDHIEVADQPTVKEHPTFASSVAILSKRQAPKATNGKSDMAPLVIELVNFDPDFVLPTVLKVDDIEYCDNGQFNDEISGDGIYTTIDVFSFQEGRHNNSNKVAFAPSFGHKGALQKKLSDVKSGSFSKGSVTIGCDIVTRPCPQTTWYNTCYFSDTCTCVYLENCRVEVSFDF